MSAPCAPIIIAVDASSEFDYEDGNRLIAAELTSRCNLNCIHCYANSHVHVRDDTFMTYDYWRRTFEWAKKEGYPSLQLIGGEVTFHPLFIPLLSFGTSLGFNIEVFSNGTIHHNEVRAALRTFRPKLAFSIYASDADAHDRVTRVRGSFSRTICSILWAIREGLILRVALVDVHNDRAAFKRIEAMLQDEGVFLTSYHRVQRVGRARSLPTASTTDQSGCGMCGKGVICIQANGDVTGCTLTRDMKLGKVGEGAYSALIHQTSGI